MKKHEFEYYRECVADSANLMMGFQCYRNGTDILLDTEFGQFKYKTQYNSVEVERFNLVMNYGKFLTEKAIQAKYNHKPELV